MGGAFIHLYSAASRAPGPPRLRVPRVRPTPRGRHVLRPPPPRPAEGAEAQLSSEPPSARRRSSGRSSRSRRQRQLPGRGSVAETGCSAGAPRAPGAAVAVAGGGERRGRPGCSWALPDRPAPRTRLAPHAPHPVLAARRGPLCVGRAAVEHAREGVAAGDELIAGPRVAHRTGRPRGAAFLRVVAGPWDLRSCTYAAGSCHCLSPARVLRPRAGAGARPPRARPALPVRTGCSGR